MRRGLRNLPITGEVNGKKVEVRSCTSEELQFAQNVVKYKTITEAARRTWPHLKKPFLKGSNWCKRPAVKAAIRAAEAQSAQDIRAMFEMCGLGIRERIIIVADLVKNPCTKPNQRIDLLKYIDELEARNKQAETQQANLLTAMVLDARRGLPDPVPPVEDACLVGGETETPTSRPS